MILSVKGQSQGKLDMKHFFLVGITFLCMAACQPHPYSQGQLLYTYHCENCHMPDGSGLGKLIPSLDASRLTLSDPQKLVCLIHNGLPVNKMTGQQMPANKKLNDVELANLVNYLGSIYASNPQTVQVDQIKKMLDGCQSR